MISVNKITKTYHGANAPALDEVTFESLPGEVTGLMGENGAGKTTLLRILATLLAPTSGSASVCGHDTVESPMKSRAVTGVLLGNDTGLYGRLTGRENIAYFGRLHGLADDRLEERVADIITLFGMGSYADRKVSSYSRGMMQKASLARVLVHDPPVLLLDEPAAGLDLTSLGVVLDFIAECRRRGKTVLFSSHSLADLERAARRLIILHRGRIADSGTLEELRDRHGAGLEELYLRIIREESK
jgi:sodium transport system ATP-binding protein